MKEIKVGIIGFGTVGAGVAANLLSNGDVIAKRTGVKLVLSKIADIDITSDRGVKVPKKILTTDARALIKEVDVVVELVGGTTIAKDFILEALKQGKPVVTANKALLAKKGEELFAAAEKSKADIYYEASVAGGIPIIKVLREGLAANRIQKIYGILNGTCNYILTRMEREGLDFEPILKDAQALGYAEAEPSLDIDGFDTAHKAAILASLAYGEWFGLDPIHIEGIRDISLVDLRFADELGYRIKLLAIIKQVKEDVQIRVHPTLIPKSALLAGIAEVFNGVMVNGDYVGDALFYGRGAGRNATASAVVADLVDVALNLKFGSHRRIPAFRIGRQYRHILPMEEIETRYYMRLQVKDKPGVIAAVAKILGDKSISISSFVQREGQSEENVSLLILTHLAKEKQIREAIAGIEKLKAVCDKVKLLRIEDI
ncbi:MAG: homoserine dehydrogenase [Victivallaceae bacterium]